MKKILFVFLAVAFLFAIFAPKVFAQEDNETIKEYTRIAGYTPDSPLYGLERAWEKIQLILTTNEEAKIRLELQLAKERLAEAEVMIQKGKPEYVPRLVNEYKEQFNKTWKEIESKYEHCMNMEEERCKRLSPVERCPNMTEDRCLNMTETICKNMSEERCKKWNNLVEKVSNETEKHIYVLEKVLEKVPEQAKSAIQHAIEVSQKGHDKAVEQMKEMRERVQNKGAETEIQEQVEEHIGEIIGNISEHGNASEKMGNMTGHESENKSTPGGPPPEHETLT